jgi:hypothetical protein
MTKKKNEKKNNFSIYMRVVKWGNYYEAITGIDDNKTRMNGYDDNMIHITDKGITSEHIDYYLHLKK